MVLFLSLVSAYFMIKTAEPSDLPDDPLHPNFHKLRVHENLYDYVNSHPGTVVLFLKTWSDDSKETTRLLNESVDVPVIVVDERHPDYMLVSSSDKSANVSMYIFNGKYLEETDLKTMNKFINGDI
jgi:hypothetical protein